MMEKGKLRAKSQDRISGAEKSCLARIHKLNIEYNITM